MRFDILAAGCVFCSTVINFLHFTCYNPETDTGYPLSRFTLLWTFFCIIMCIGVQ